jgi:exodeoxyribonuclease VII small subunit
MTKTASVSDSPVAGARQRGAGAAPAPVNYEAALEELEKLVSQLEGGQLPLDQLLTGYQRGAQLLAFCRDKLSAVENQIKVLEAGELKTWTKD